MKVRKKDKSEGIIFNTSQKPDVPTIIVEEKLEKLPPELKRELLRLSTHLTRHLLMVLDKVIRYLATGQGDEKTLLQELASVKNVIEKLEETHAKNNRDRYQHPRSKSGPGMGGYDPLG